MSHITDIDKTITVTNLLALKMAVEHFCPDCELVEGANHYRTWKDDHGGKLVGDWPLPQGMTEADIGENAVHVIRVKDEWLAAKGLSRTDDKAPYEIGVVPHPNKPGEFVLMTDWWNNGNGLMTLEGLGKRHTVTDPETGENKESAFEDLYMHYRMMETKLESERLGDQIDFQKENDGTWTAKIHTEARLSY